MMRSCRVSRRIPRSIDEHGYNRRILRVHIDVLSGPCTAALLTYASSLVVDASDDLAFSVDVGSAANVGDVCSFD